MLKQQIVVDANKDVVWQAWTNSERVSEWFAHDACIEAVEGGSYQISVHSVNQSESCKILSIQPSYRLVFQWKVPEELEVFDKLKDFSTIVAVSLKELDNQTAVTLSHSGWGEGEEWLQAMEWHKHSWRKILASLKSFLETGISLKNGELSNK